MKGKAVLALAALGLASPAALIAQGATFQNIDNGFWFQEANWEIIDGTSANTIPGAGDNVVIKAGTLVEINEPRVAEDITIEGSLRGSTAGAEFNLSHTFANVTVKPGGWWQVSDGREDEEIITRVTGDVVIEDGGLVQGLAFGGDTLCRLIIEGDLIDETTTFRFAINSSTGPWNIEFDGSEPSTIQFATGDASRDLTNVIIRAGAHVTVDTFQPIWLLVDGTFTVENGGTLELVESAFFAGGGNVDLESGSTVIFANPNGFSNAVFQNAGTKTFSTEGNYAFTALEGGNVGPLAPETFNSLKIDTPDIVTLNKNLSVSGPLVLENGRLDTYDTAAEQDFFLYASADEANIQRTNGWVNGNLARTVDASVTGARSFPVGTEDAYTPVAIDITGAGSGFGFLTVKAFDGIHDPAPSLPSLARYWSIDGGAYSGYTATLSFTYDAADPGSLDEAKLRAARFTAPSTFNIPEGQSVDTASNTVTVPGVTAFSNWTIVEDDSVVSHVSDWTLF